MSSKNSIQIGLDFILNNAQSSIKQVQSLLDGLNISKLDAQFGKNFSASMVKLLNTLSTESEKLKTSLQEGLNGKVDEKGITNSINNIIKVYDLLEVELNKIASLPLVDMERLIKIDPNLAKEITNIELKIQHLLKTISEESKSGLAKALEEVNTATAGFVKGSSPDKHVKELNNALNSSKIDIEEYAIALKGLLAKYADYIESSKKAAQNAGQEWDKSGNITRNAQAFDALLQAIERVVPGIKEVKTLTSGLESERVSKMSLAYTEVATKAEQTAKGVKEASSGMQDYGRTMTSAARALNEFIGELDLVKSRVKYFFSLTNSILLFKNAIRDAYETVKELDAAMTETAVVTDFSVSDMWDALPQYTKLAESLGATTLGAYETMTLYYQLGLKTNEAMQLGTETMKMARIAGMDYATATNLMTSALRGFNLELNTTSALRVNDVYSELAAITATDTEGIATAMSKTASIANSANMELETTSAFLSLIIETTQEAPETAGTALKTIIARFSEVKKLYSQGQFTGTDSEGEAIEVNKVATALKTAGINMNKFFSGLVGLDDIFLELAEKWNTLDITQLRYIATLAAGSRLQSRFIAMMSNYDRTMELVNAAYSSNGASAELFAKTQDSLLSKLNKLSDEWERFTMGLANSAVIKGAVDLLTNLLSTINNLTEAFDSGKGITSGILKFTAALGAIKLGKTLLNGGLTGVIGNLSDSFNKMDTSGIGKAGDNAGKTFGTSFVTSLNLKISNNSIFGKVNTSLTSGINDWYLKLLGKLNTSKFIQNTFGNLKTVKLFDLGSMLSKNFSVKTLGGNFGQEFSTEIERQLRPLLTSTLTGMGDEIAKKTMDTIFTNFKNISSTGDLQAGLKLLGQDIEKSLFRSANFLGLDGEAAESWVAELKKKILDSLNINLDELDENVAPAAAKGFNNVKDALSGISAVGTGAAVAIGLVSNKLREAGNDKAADVLDKISSGLMIVSTVAGVAATAMQVFASGALSALIPLLPAILAIGAAIGLVVATIKAIEASSVTELSKEIDRLTESTENAQKAAESLLESYDNFSSAKESYQSLREELENLTKGTLAYLEKLLEVNRAASELTGEYDVKYKVSSDGLIVVDEQDLLAKMLESLEKSTLALNIQRGLEERLSNDQTFLNFLKSDNEVDEKALLIIRDTLENSGTEIVDTSFDNYIEGYNNLHTLGSFTLLEGEANPWQGISTADWVKTLKEAVYLGALTPNGVENEEVIKAILLDNGITNLSQIDALITAIEKSGENLYNEIEEVYDKIPLETDSVNLIKSILSTNKDIIDSGEIEAIAQYLGKYDTSKNISDKAAEQVNSMKPEKVYEKYAGLLGYTYNNGKMFDKNNQEITNLEDLLDSMRDYLKEAFSQDAYLKLGETLAKLFEKIDKVNSSSGVNNLMGALTEGSTRIDKKFIDTIKGISETGKMQKALHLSEADYGVLAENLGMSTQSLTSYFKLMATNIADAQAKLLDALQAAFVGDFSKGENDKIAGIVEGTFEKKMEALNSSLITFLAETAASLLKNFGTDLVKNFLDLAIGDNYSNLKNETDLSDFINAINRSLGDIEFSNAIDSATKLHQAELLAKNTLTEMGKDIDNITFDNLTTTAEKSAYTVYNLSKNLLELIGNASQFKQLYQSDEWTNIEKRAAKLKENGVLDSDDVTTLASEFDTLRQVMKNTGIGALGVADIMNALANGTLSNIDDLDEGLWQLIDDTNALATTVDKALSFVKNFDPGIDEGEVDDWLKSTKEKVNELFDNGEYGNTLLYNYLDALYSDFAKDAAKDLKAAEKKYLAKLNVGKTDNFSGIWRDIATDTTGNYNAKMKARGWTVTPEANGGTGIDFTGAKGMKGTTKELRQALMESYGATEDMANMLITSFKNASATFRLTMEWNDFSAGVSKYVGQLETEQGRYVFSSKKIEQTAAMTGKSTLEIYKKIAEQQGISKDVIKSFKSADDAIRELNKSTNNYVINLTKLDGTLKTTLELLKDLNRAYGGEKGKTGKAWDYGASNWLTTFSKGDTVDIAKVKSGLGKLGFSENDLIDLIEEGLKQLSKKGASKTWTYKGVKLDYDELTTDTANALQEAMDKLDNTNLVNNIKNGFVEGWLEAQELMELKTKNNWNTNEAKQYYNSGLNKQNNGENTYNSLKASIESRGGKMENATIKIRSDGYIEAYDEVNKVRALIVDVNNTPISPKVDNTEVNSTEKKLEGLTEKTYKINNKETKFYIDSNLNTVYDEAGKFYGVLNALGRPVKVEVSDGGNMVKLTDLGEDYYFTLDKVSGEWKTVLKSNAPEEKWKVDLYAAALRNIPKNITSTITKRTITVNEIQNSVTTTVGGHAAKSGRMRVGSAEYNAFQKAFPGAKWHVTDYPYGYFDTHAKGTSRTGVPRNETALVGEEGPELVETNDGKAHLVGMHGPEITKLKKGDIVHNANDTDRILKGKPTKKMRAYKTGTFSAYKDTAYTGQNRNNSGSGGSSSSKKNSGSGSGSSGESAYQKAKSYYDNLFQNDVISIEWYINRLNNMRKTISMTTEEQQELNKAIADAKYDKLSNEVARGTRSYSDLHKAITLLWNVYKNSKKTTTEAARKLALELRELWKEDIDSQFELGRISPELYIKSMKKLLSWYKKDSAKWRDYLKIILSQEQENLENRFNNGEISMWQYIEGLKKLQKLYAATSVQARELSKQIRDLNTTYAEAAQQHGLWSMDWMITKLKENLALMKKDTEEYRELLDKIRDYEMQNALNKYERRQWTYEQTMAFYKQYEAENNFAKTTEQYLELKLKLTELEIDHINELLDKYSKLNDLLGKIDTGEERAKEIININNELSDTHDRLVDIKYALENQELTEAQRKAFQEEYNELLVRQINLIDEAQEKLKEYTDIMKEGIEAQKKLLTDGWGTDDPKKAARLGLMSVQYAENDRYLAQLKKETAKNNMYAALIEPLAALTQKYIAEVALKRANGEYKDDLEYATAISEATAKGMMNAPTSALPYARIDDTSGMVTIDQAALNGLKVSDPEEYRKVMEIITLMQGYSEDWMEGNVAEVEAVELLDELTSNQDYIDLINRTANALKEIDLNELEELQDQQDSIKEIADSVASIVEKVREAVDKIREQRDNEENRLNLIDKLTKLAYLRLDSTGNALEIKLLEKELSEESLSYTDTLIDLKINELEELNEETQDLLQELIDLKQQEIKQKEKEGTYYELAQKVVDEFISNDLESVSNNTKDIRDTYLGLILKEGEKIDTSMSKPELENTWNEIIKEGEAAGTAKELHDTAKDVGLTQETAKDAAKSFVETSKDIALVTGLIATSFVPALDYAINSIAEAVKKDKENKAYTDDLLAGKTESKPNGVDSAPKPAEKPSTPALPAKPALPSKPAQPSKPALPAKPSKPAATLGDGKPKVGDNVTFVSGLYYNSSDGESPVGYWYRGLKNKVYITKINTASWATHPYHISSTKTFGKGDLGWVKLNLLQGYKTGGMVDFTGPAWLDGTKSRPESVLSARDTQNLLALTDVLSNLRNNTITSNNASNISNEINIEVKVDKMDNDVDVNKLADTIGEKVKRSIYKDTKGFSNTRLTHR